MRVFVAGAGGNDAAVGDFADGVLELDGGVVNVEAGPAVAESRRRRFSHSEARMSAMPTWQDSE